MAREGFLNENTGRAYPLINGYDPQPVGEIPSLSSSSGLELPTEAIVDIGVIMGLDAEYDDTVDAVYLYQVRRSGDLVEFELRTTAPAAEGWSLVFTRDVVNDGDWVPEHVEATIGGSSSSFSASTDCRGSEPPWEGFLVSGFLAELAAVLEDGEVMDFSDRRWQLEPGRIQNLRQSFARSVSLANYDRTHTAPPPDCDSTSSIAESEVFLNAGCLAGPLWIKEGYNISVRQEDNTNTLIISAAVGSGAGLACSEVPLYDDEEAPAGSNVLTGGPRCTEVLKTLNGVGGRTIRLTAGPGILLSTDEDLPNALIVAIDRRDYAVCGLLDDVVITPPPLIESSSESEGAE